MGRYSFWIDRSAPGCSLYEIRDNGAVSLIENQLDIVNQVDESTSEVTINNGESLDEIISNYEANTQN